MGIRLKRPGTAVSFSRSHFYDTVNKVGKAKFVLGDTTVLGFQERVSERYT